MTFVLQILTLISIVLTSIVAGMFFGPWLALSRSFSSCDPEFFIQAVQKMNNNMRSFMRFLMPVTLLWIVPVLVLSYSEDTIAFYLNLTGFFSLLAALLVTVTIEV